MANYQRDIIGLSVWSAGVPVWWFVGLLHAGSMFGTFSFVMVGMSALAALIHAKALW